jgi:predicted signal transduction protein with EAL and GGDEF domain
VAGRLSQVAPGTATVARLGGDEFAVVLPDTGLAGAMSTVADIQSVFAAPFVVEGRRLTAGTSIGICVYPADGDDGSTLLRHADVAMYMAKRGRQGYALYEAAHDAYTPDRIALIDELRTALERGILHLEYQPKVHACTGVVEGVEALVRWNRENHGLIQPEDFIGLAEETGLIEPLTVHVLDTALRQLRVWAGQGIRLCVSVNLSARSLHDASFVQTVDQLLSRHAVEASSLVLEITESTMMTDPARVLSVLQPLHDLGVRISVDDFGTGYSSLAYLRRMPVDEIKIDRSFVSALTVNETDEAIARSVVSLGHSLGVTVTGEGVENAETRAALEAMGCDLLQGFAIAPPLPEGALVRWLRRHTDVRSA